ncbi:MAG: hypothetical protein K5899_11290 [Bacteroidaceae bacterium]|nr:hypothetical protein [Bacteroidaceae bacterium]
MRVICGLLPLLLIVLSSCNSRESLNDENAVYYWRTEWRLDSLERSFLSRYDVRRVFCRYFDVVIDDTDDSDPHPNATISFVDSVPSDLEIIPTVYITEACMHRRHEGLAEKVVRRLVQMNETHDVMGVKEIQMDCDYTVQSRQLYYDFLADVRRIAADHGLRLSTTIRLHQLSMPVPPVDYGVLMIYNTGDPRRFEERNPILDLRDVQPYLRYLDDYQLPLAAAYPVYEWVRTISGVHITHEVEADEILNVKSAVEAERDDLRHTILLYHLDADNIQRYENETFDAIYCH